MNRFVSLAALAILVVLHAPAMYSLGGHVVDANTGRAIPNATITTDGRAIQTDAEGRFQFANEGKPVAVRAPGYRAASYSYPQITKQGGTLALVPFTPKALYLTVYGIGSKKLRNGALDWIQRGAANALVIDIKGDRGIIPYPSTVPLTKVDGARKITTIPDLGSLVRELHSKGIYAIARIVVFKDDPLANARPDLAVKRQDGHLFRDKEGLAWTDPFLSEVRNYNIAIAVEAARAGFDEIQFDYVRFPDSSQKLQFSQPTTQASRTQAIEGFLAEARQQLQPYNVYLSVDIFGYVLWNQNDTGIGQQLEGIAKHVDYLCPMLYPSGFRYGIPGYKNPVANPYVIVKLSLDNAERRVGISPKRFRPWLQAFRDYAFDRRNFGAAEVEAQIRAAKDFGADGWMLWNPRNNYDGIGLGAELRSSVDHPQGITRHNSR
ncbi:MAG: putative glycoside hydrolase [Acidobacteriaceae bacterium]